MSGSGEVTDYDLTVLWKMLDWSERKQVFMLAMQLIDKRAPETWVEAHSPEARERWIERQSYSGGIAGGNEPDG